MQTHIWCNFFITKYGKEAQYEGVRQSRVIPNCACEDSISHTFFLLFLLVIISDEAFIAYKTSAYKIHLFETPSGFKFVLFSDPNVDSLRFILRQIYQGAFMDFVVRNPMVELDSRISGKGIDSQAFRTR